MMHARAARIALPLVFVALTAIGLAAPPEPAAKPERPTQWAQPVELPGCPNLHKISETLYRGAQPTAEGFRELHKLGIRTVINLRMMHSDRDEIGDLDFNYIAIPMEAWDADGKEIIQFLKAVTNKDNAPVFFHCQHGADRTGTMCAIYRIAVQGWTKEQAIEEMTEGGYNFHTIWRNLVTYIRKLDVEKIRRKAGINTARDGERGGAESREKGHEGTAATDKH